MLALSQTHVDPFRMITINVMNVNVKMVFAAADVRYRTRFNFNS